MICRECGQKMCIGPCEHEDSEGVSHHLSESGGIDYYTDEDHVALQDDDPFGMGYEESMFG